MATQVHSPQPNVIELLRVSTDSQDVARQRDDIEYVKDKYGLRTRRTLELVGVSGTATLDDKQVQQVLADLERPDVDGIAVSSMDRLFRPKEYGAFAILDRFVKQNKKIWSTREGEVDPATDEGYDKCISAGGRAGAEWRELRRRSAGGRKKKLERGRLDHGSARYGYVHIPKWQPNGARFELDTSITWNEWTKADVVCTIFRWARGGMAPNAIAAKLNAMKIPSAGYNGRPPGEWSRQMIRQVLRSTTYIGQHKRCGIIVECPRIIEDELFYTVQKILDTNRKRHIGRPSSLFLLRTFLWCAKCMHRCVGKRDGRKKDLAIYRCGNMTNKPPVKRLCDAPAVNIKKLERAAWDAIWEMLTNPKLLLEMGQAFYEAIEKRTSGDGAAQLRNELTSLRAGIKTTQRMMKDGAIDYDEGLADVLRDKERLAKIECELAGAGRVCELPPLRATEAALRDIAEGAEPETYEERRNILEGILDLRITYFDGDLSIEGKVAIPDLAVSTGSRVKKRKGRVDPPSVSFQPIPFAITRRVA